VDEELKVALSDLINDYGIEDYVYNIREQVLDDTEWFDANPDKSSWDHPKVERYGELIETIKGAIE